MTFVLGAAAMREADADACKTLGAPALMRNAGDAIATYLVARADGGRIVAFAGPGNNGGDAFAALASLGTAYRRTVYAAATANVSPARDEAQRRARASGVELHALPETGDDARDAVASASVIVDALFGTGARLPIDPRYKACIENMDRARAHVVSIDIPTGVDADTGEVSDTAVRASATIALAALKPGMLLFPGRDHCGDIWLAPIGIDDTTLGAHAGQWASLDDAAFRAMLPLRATNADKRSSGAPLIVAGSQQFPGAAVLCAMGAARSGAGYVTVVTPPAAANSVRTHLLEQVVIELSDGTPAQRADDVLDIARHNGAVAIGPGLSLSDETGAFVRALIERCELPMVIDASALFHLAKHLDILRGKRVVITPHAGEFARLSGSGTVEPGTRVKRVRAFVERTGVTTLLKGSDTIVDDGTTMHINATGTSALATAGTGDVLTGIIATLLSQGLSPVDAARAGAYWHGMAAQTAARERPRGVIARDVYETLGVTLRSQASSTSGLRRVFASAD